LIDCIFFLLMFFMVATSFTQQTEAEKRKELPWCCPPRRPRSRQGRAVQRPW
jgi:biopolymer transport protein ExbD